MSKQLILLRHGIAESRAEDGTDFNRKLTDEGILKLKKRLPNIRNVLEFPDKVKIWSSPLRRAKETAEILSESIGSDTIFDYDFIASGDYDEFKASLSQVEDNTTVIVVGHEPHLGDWSYELAETSISFKKGAAAAFSMEKVNGDENKSSEFSFSWYFEPKEMEKIEEKVEKRS